MSEPHESQPRPHQPIVEVVSHCWNYRRLLTYQLSGFVLYPPTQSSLVVTVFHCDEDRDTVATLDYFLSHAIENVRWQFLPMQRRLLLRRAIGRNRACKSTLADVVLMTDCDYVFRGDAIDTIASSMLTADSPRLGYVREHIASKSHDDGDAEIARVVSPGTYDVDPWRYEPSRLRTAIGGAQIVLGDWARANGYLPDSRRFQRPASEWKRTFEDVAFRKSCGLDTLPINCSSSVYRIRHSKRGRHDIGVKL